MDRARGRGPGALRMRSERRCAAPGDRRREQDARGVVGAVRADARAAATFPRADRGPGRPGGLRLPDRAGLRVPPVAAARRRLPDPLPRPPAGDIPARPLAAAAGALPAGKVWISAPLTGSAADRLLAAQAEGLAPMLPLTSSLGDPGAPHRWASRVVEGVPMHEYRVSVDLARALSAARRARSAGIAAAIEQELDASPSGPLVDARLGERARLRREDRVGGPGSGLGTASIWFLSYTKPYTGTAPPGSQIVPLASLARSGRSLWRIATGS